MNHLRVNQQDLIYLNERTITVIFDCVYGMDGSLRADSIDLLREPNFKDLVQMLNTMQEYNYRYRQDQLSDLFLIFDQTVGPMETNSDGTVLWLAMGLAIKDLYRLRTETLAELLKLVKVKK